MDDSVQSKNAFVKRTKLLSDIHQSKGKFAKLIFIFSQKKFMFNCYPGQILLVYSRNMQPKNDGLTPCWIRNIATQKYIDLKRFGLIQNHSQSYLN